MSVNEKMTAIADAIREKTGGTDALTLDGMADAIPEVYKAGVRYYNDVFWEQFQNHGNGQNYVYAFSYNRVTNKTYNPKYDLVLNTSSNAGNNTFYSTSVTDTKVAIYANDVANCIQGMFYRATKMVTIRKLVVQEITAYTNTFSNCTALENITFEGTIGQNMDIHWSTLLTHESLMSIIEHLGTVTATRTLTIGEENLAKLTDTEKAIATQKGWTLA